MSPRTGLGLDRYVREPDDVAGARLVMGERVGGRSETIETGLRSVQPQNHSCANLPLEPHVFHAPTVVLAVDHDGQPLELSPRAGRRAGVVDNRQHLVLL
jgi:hypothetical protein